MKIDRLHLFLIIASAGFGITALVTSYNANKERHRASALSSVVEAAFVDRHYAVREALFRPRSEEESQKIADQAKVQRDRHLGALSSEEAILFRIAETKASYVVGAATAQP